MTIKQLIEAWNNFWFAPDSVLPVCLLRMYLGVVTIIWCILLAPEVTNFYGTHRMMPTAGGNDWFGFTVLNVFEVLPRSDSTATGALLVTAVAAMALTLGLLTRLGLLVLVVCLVSFAHDCPLIMHSGDTFLRVLMFLLLFAPCNKMLSLDQVLWKRLRRNGADDVPRDQFGDPVWPRWVTRLIQLQVCAIYYQTFWAKLRGESWLDGTAVYYTSHLVEFSKFSLPYVFEHLWTIKMLTWGTLFIEFSLFTLIWVKELRYFVLLAAIVMHLSIDWTMNIPLFEWVMMGSFISFVSAADIRRALAFVQNRLGQRLSGKSSIRALE
ncbi:MAG: HTTM domain-containing protein [Candidatus Obscuribacterales bacterium]